MVTNTLSGSQIVMLTILDLGSALPGGGTVQEIIDAITLIVIRIRRALATAEQGTTLGGGRVFLGRLLIGWRRSW